MASHPVTTIEHTYSLLEEVTWAMAEASRMSLSETRRYMRKRMVRKLRAAGAEGPVHWIVESDAHYLRIWACCGDAAARWARIRRAQRRADAALGTDGVIRPEGGRQSMQPFKG